MSSMRLVLLALLVSSAAAYRFLVVFPLPSGSHSILGKGIVKSLTDAGHEVTFITAFPKNEPDALVQEVDSSFLKFTHMPNFFTGTVNRLSFSRAKEVGFNLSTSLIKHEAVQQLMFDTSRRFDAVIAESFFCELYTGFAQVFSCPWIQFLPAGMTPTMEYLMNEVQSPATAPVFFTSYTVPMSLKERIVNTFNVFSLIFWTAFIDLPKQAIPYEQFFGPAARVRGVRLAPFTDAVHNVSLVLVNSHPLLGQPMRLPPNVVDVAGFHIDEDVKPLPKDLQDLLDGAHGGALYFSMGSNIKSADMPASMRSELLAMFGRLPLVVLWKFEMELPDAPKNVHVRPWLPQQSILAHRNLKIFVTHGGMLSTTEALHFGVPLVAVPLFGDQFINSQRAARRGYCLTVDLHEPRLADNLEKAIRTMLSDPTYSTRARELSQVFRDRLVPPGVLVSHYAAHAVRTRGALHLRSVARDVPAHQRLLLDLLALLAAASLAAAFVAKRLWRHFVPATAKSRDNSSKIKKNI